MKKSIVLLFLFVFIGVVFAVGSNIVSQPMTDFNYRPNPKVIAGIQRIQSKNPKVAIVISFNSDGINLNSEPIVSSFGKQQKTYFKYTDRNGKKYVHIPSTQTSKLPEQHREDFEKAKEFFAAAFPTKPKVSKPMSSVFTRECR